MMVEVVGGVKLRSLYLEIGKVNNLNKNYRNKLMKNGL